MTQEEALAILKTGASAFITGEPGSGKSHTIRAYVQWLRERGIEPAITAATGIAATHIGGMTLHSWSGLGIAQSLSEAEVDRVASKEHVARRIQKAYVLIIDEVSMLSAEALDSVSAVCKAVRRDDRPFGGLTVVLVGDFFQLPPVSRAASVAFAWEASSWRQLNPLICYLQEQHRQDDPGFLAVLSAIRAQAVDDALREQLQDRAITPDAMPEDVPKLFAHNADVDALNAAALKELAGSSRHFFMRDAGRAALVENLKRGCLSPEDLELKEGAQVIFTKNAQGGAYVNGTLGTVISFMRSSGAPIVETHDGARITVEPVEWQVEEQGKVLASITQVPLRLAYALTIHKSQGMSMDAACIDLSRAFAFGQGYVALSRVRRLSGMYLLGLNERALEVDPRVASKDSVFQEASRAAAHTFAQLPPDELQAMQKRFVHYCKGTWDELTDEGNGRVSKRLQVTKEVLQRVGTLTEAAEVRGVTQSTVVRHVEELADAGAIAPEDVRTFLPSGEAQQEIMSALDQSSDDRLAPVFNALNKRYSYETIRLVRLMQRW